MQICNPKQRQPAENNAQGCYEKCNRRSRESYILLLSLAPTYTNHVSPIIAEACSRSWNITFAPCSRCAEAITVVTYTSIRDLVRSSMTDGRCSCLLMVRPCNHRFPERRPTVVFLGDENFRTSPHVIPRAFSASISQRKCTSISREGVWLAAYNGQDRGVWWWTTTGVMHDLVWAECGVEGD